MSVLVTAKPRRSARLALWTPSGRTRILLVPATRAHRSEAEPFTARFQGQMSEIWKPDIYGYTDYREYLSDYYDAAKENVPAFSYRYFSRRAGYKSPNFLQLVIQGKRNLTVASGSQFARALGLDEKEREFFLNLVEFNQADSSDERNAAWDKVAASRRFAKAHRLDAAYYKYTAHWYIAAIREMAAYPGFRLDPEWIAERLLPPIEPREASNALNVLFELELLVEDENGRVSLGTPTLTTGHSVRTLSVGNYHRQMLERASESLDIVDGQLRELAGFTVCIPEHLVPDLKEKMREFRTQLLDLCDRQEEQEVVYQFNLQLFPLSQALDETDDD